MPSHSTGSSSAILLAAGSGSRMQGQVADKILVQLNGLPVFAYSIRAFVESGIVDHFTIVYRDEAQKVELQKALDPLDLNGKTVNWTLGGAERQDSVYNALETQSENCAYVYIHDCARPLVSVESLQALQTAVVKDHAAVLAHPVTDTIKRIAHADQHRQAELEDLERDRLWAMETPQAFDYHKILRAYTHVHESGLSITDDTAAAATIGLGATLVLNSRPNPKITTPIDLKYAEWLLRP
jgi:2-C-methyl-D-erythritol 4-phosphate cytidylyltransferase